jgi:aspartate carbamoyltransferase regulatory subunit
MKEEESKMVRKDIISLSNEELYDEVEKVLIKTAEDMSLNDLKDHFIEERMDYYMNHADEDEIDIILTDYFEYLEMKEKRNGISN